MRSTVRRRLRSIARAVGSAVLATVVSAAAVPTAAAARSRVTGLPVLRVAQRVTGGVVGAVKQVERTLSPSSVLDNVRTAYFTANVPFGSTIVREAKKNGLAPELVAAVIKAESKFRPNARSSAGALGLMQLLPRTGRWLGATNLLDPQQNIMAGARYLKYLSQEFGGNERDVIAAYNAGDGNVRKFGGPPPFAETRSYIQIVSNYRKEFSKSISFALASAGADAGL